MTLRFRRFLFYSFLAIFISLSAAIIFYASGWRFNLENFEALKTGAVYIETEPKDAKIEIDGEIFPNRSGIIQNGTLILDLAPRNYELKITKTGYSPYFKNLEVKPYIVSEALNVILTPEKIVERQIMEYKLKGDELVASNGNGKIIIKNRENGNYYLYDLENSSSVFNISAAVENEIKGAEIKKISFHPFAPEKLLAELSAKSQISLRVITIGKSKSETLPLKSGAKLAAWDINGSGAYFVASEAAAQKTAPLKFYLSYFNLAIKMETRLAEFSEKNLGGKITEIKVSPNGEIGALNDKGDLYIFSANGENLIQIAHDVKFFAFSPDGKKIAFIDSDGKLNVYFLKAQFKNISKKPGDVIRFELPDKNLIGGFFWHQDSYHLFIEYKSENGKKIEFMEIDDRPPLNKHNLIQADDFYYDGKSSKIYFIQEGKLYMFEM